MPRGEYGCTYVTGANEQSLTAVLQAWHAGDGAAYGELFERAYAELRQIASQRIRSMADSATLSPTELVNEAVVRVLGSELRWQDRNHFFASMSLCMRSVLIDRARARQSERRGGGALHVTLGQVDEGAESQIEELLALDRALRRLDALDPRSSAVLHLTYFGGLARAQIADVLGVSTQIVDRELRFGRSWLNTHIDTHL